MLLPLLSYHVIAGCLRLKKETKQNNTTTLFHLLKHGIIKGNPETKNPKIQLATIKFPITSRISSPEQAGLLHVIAL